VKYSFFKKNIADDWMSDGYRFRQNGISFMPKKHPVLKKIHYLIFLPEGQKGSFKKFVYQLLHDSKYLVIHYSGNELLFHATINVSQSLHVTVQKLMCAGKKLYVSYPTCCMHINE
jgi:hypothetical protein